LTALRPRVIAFDGIPRRWRASRGGLSARHQWRPAPGKALEPAQRRRAVFRIWPIKEYDDAEIGHHPRRERAHRAGKGRPDTATRPSLAGSWPRRSSTAEKQPPARSSSTVDPARVTAHARALNKAGAFFAPASSHVELDGPLVSRLAPGREDRTRLTDEPRACIWIQCVSAHRFARHRRYPPGASSSNQEKSPSNPPLRAAHSQHRAARDSKPGLLRGEKSLRASSSILDGLEMRRQRAFRPESRSRYSRARGPSSRAQLHDRLQCAGTSPTARSRGQAQPSGPDRRRRSYWTSDRAQLRQAGARKRRQGADAGSGEQGAPPRSAAPRAPHRVARWRRAGADKRAARLPARLKDA